MDVMRRSSASNSGVTRCGSWYFGPPWTTRCATTPTAPKSPLASNQSSNARVTSAGGFDGNASDRYGPAASLHFKTVPGKPILSTCPDNPREGGVLLVKNANRMLDEPTLIVSTRAGASALRLELVIDEAGA